MGSRPTGVSHGAHIFKRSLIACSLPLVGAEEQRWYLFGRVVTSQFNHKSYRRGAEIKKLGTCVVHIATPPLRHNDHVERDKLLSLLIINRMAFESGIDSTFLQFRNATPRAVPFSFDMYTVVNFRRAARGTTLWV